MVAAEAEVATEAAAIPEVAAVAVAERKETARTGLLGPRVVATSEPSPKTTTSHSDDPSGLEPAGLRPQNSGGRGQGLPPLPRQEKVSDPHP